MKREVINIELSRQSLKKMLLNVMLDTKHKNLIAESILDNLQNSSGDQALSNVFYALQGVKPELTDYGLSIGDVASIKYDNLYTYNVDKEAMQKLGIVLGNTVQVSVIGFDPLRKDCIEIRYVCINKDGKKKINEDFTYPEYLILKSKNHDKTNDVRYDVPF